MPHLLTEDALFACMHETGTARAPASQGLVSVAGRKLLVRPDPVGRPIGGCNIPPPQKLCTSTVNVLSGYSGWIRIDGRPVCLRTLQGFTDGSPPGAARYKVRSPGQTLVTQEGS